MPSPRKVLVLNHFAAPRGLPGGTRHVELFSRLSGWESRIIASDRNHLTGELVPSESEFITVRTSAYTANGITRVLNWVSYALGALIAGMRQPKPDLVYASSPHLLTGAAGWLISKFRGVPFVLEVRDLWPRVLLDMGQMSGRHPVYRALEALEGFLYARAKQIIVMAPGTRMTLTQRGITPTRISYIPNGADPSDFVPTAPRVKLRERYGFTRFTLLYAGAHGPANGLDLLLDAARSCADLPVDIVLVGGGVAKRDLEARVATEGIDNVRFLAPVSKAEVPDILHAADCGLHVLADVPLFQSSVSPNKLFDYMAAGRPVLTNSAGLVAEWVKLAGCGVACAPGDLAEGIRRIAQTPQAELNEMGLNGRRWIEENQSRSAMAVNLQDVLNRAVNGQ